MWPKNYRDYPPDSCLKKEWVEPSHGLVGCEMHDTNGWGTSYHRQPRKKRKGLFATLIDAISKKFK